MSAIASAINAQMSSVESALNRGDLAAIIRLMDSIIPGFSRRANDELARDSRAAEEYIRRQIEAQKRADADTEFRMEVIEEMVAAGVARHVAANLTNTEAKMLEQARKYGVI